MLCFSGITNTGLAAEEKTDPLIENGIGQYKHENYDEALVTLKKAREGNPQSSLAAYYLGLTYKQMQDYQEAISNLKDAVTFSPKIAGAMPELIDCLYQLGRTKEAMAWIAQAETDGIRPAQVAFIKGMVLLKDEKWEDAVGAFKKAKELDPSMAQSCDYQIGMAYIKGKKITEAQKAFTEVVLTDPNSNMANFANEYVSVLSKRKEAEKPFKITFDAAWQYDDNVVLKPDDAVSAVDVSDKADSRQVYTASGEYNHMFNDWLGARALYTFYYAKQSNLGFYDTCVNNFMVQPTVYMANTLITFPSGYSHTLINDKAYLSNPYTTAMCNFMVGDSNMAQASVSYQYQDYLWDPSIPEENRDGNDMGASMGWYQFFEGKKGFLNLRYAIDKDWTRGEDWEYLGNRVSATLLVPGSIFHSLLDNFNLTVSGDIYFQNFSNSNVVYNVHRKDTVYTVSAMASYKIFKGAEIQLQYTHVTDNSNISVYQYNRNVYSAGVEIKF
jgi:tetratricopeptide (TPR) repeat protein